MIAIGSVIGAYGRLHDPGLGSGRRQVIRRRDAVETAHSVVARRSRRRRDHLRILDRRVGLVCLHAECLLLVVAFAGGHVRLVVHIIRQTVLLAVIVLTVLVAGDVLTQQVYVFLLLKMEALLLMLVLLLKLLLLLVLCGLMNDVLQHHTGLLLALHHHG